MEKVRVRLRLSGLSCKGCAARVRFALERAGAEEVNVSLEKAEFMVNEREEIERSIKVVKKAGYEVEMD